MFRIIFSLGVLIATTIAQDWTLLPGAAVEISAKGNEVWVINSAQQIFRWDGGNWQLMPGGAVRAGASPDGWSWVVNSADQIWRWNPNSKGWELMPGGLVQISAASKDRALGVNRGQQIWLWENNGWKNLPGAATWAGIGDDDERWVINSAQQIWRWNHKSNNWDLMPGAAVNVDVQSPSRVIVTNAQNQMWIWQNNNWKLLTGGGVRSSITHKHFYTVNSASQLWRGEFKEEAPAPQRAEKQCPVCPKCPDQEVRVDHVDVQERVNVVEKVVIMEDDKVVYQN